ncbi:zinc ABC transporter substrate-binding protein [Defluviimonas sp. D31]|uniref:zinc ABC transporter substrate-binding protein n=1 Tax=Defluviimonas sp. D31 TaxID=3083253 RepID=UPI00296E637F|nr:zinc ABC transporter substrate-binding protein [Defluviimonas sp. D31]MDW4550972.1 zinc ABC transporter substrate-binding protein [Defluviimonas sp. D31]
MRLTVSLLAALTFAATPLKADPLAVVTDIPVVQSLAALVMGDLGTPALLLEAGADPHDFQLRPSQVRALQSAELVIWIGPEMTPWLDRALAAAPEVTTLSLLHDKATHLHHYGEEPTTEVSHADHESTHGEDAHGAEGTDPHAWLDPDNAALWIGLITDALVARDPGNSVAYRANASLALMRIKTIDQALAKRLAPHGDVGFVVTHDAYGYFTEHYGLTVTASLASGDAHEPGAAHLSEVRSLLEAGEADCIFPEVGRDPTPVETLAEGTPVRIGAPLDPEGRGEATGAELYPALLQNLGTAIADCLDAD